MDDLPSDSYFIAIDKDKWILHRRVGHISMKIISYLSKLDLVRGLSKINFDKYNICEVCTWVKQVKSSFHSKNIVSTNKPLELLNIDLFGSVKTNNHMVGRDMGS